MNEFQFPRIALGTLVEVSRDHVNFSKPMLGLVVNPKTRSADIVIPTPMGMRFVVAALHRDDPQVKTNPDRFDPDKGYENSGVFVLAQSELRMRQIEEDYRHLRTGIMATQEAHRALAERVQVVESAREPVIERRGPGRPPKQRVLEEVG